MFTQSLPVTYAKASAARWHIPASVTLAQFGLESGWGAHMPPGSNNPFGIKARPGDPSVTVATREFVGGRYVTVQAAFRAFPDLGAAFDAHAELLASAPAYGPARALLPDVHAFCVEMGKVYATAPGYGERLWQLIEADGLTKYDVDVSSNVEG